MVGPPISATESERTARALFPGWDNASFFDPFRQILFHGSFSSLSGPGEGLPQTWALLVRLWSPHPPTATHWVLNAYDVVLLLTLGAIVTLGCMSVARLCGKDFWVALPAMAAVVQIFVLGRLWIVNGYPTFDLPIAAVAAAVLLPWRTTLSPWLNFFTVAGLTLVAAYTWYPLILLSAPALIAAALRLIKGSSRRSLALSALASLHGNCVLGSPSPLPRRSGQALYSRCGRRPFITARSSLLELLGR